MGKKHDPNTILKTSNGYPTNLSDSSCSSEQISKGLDMHCIFHMVIMPGSRGFGTRFDIFNGTFS